MLPQSTVGQVDLPDAFHSESVAVGFWVVNDTKRSTSPAAIVRATVIASEVESTQKR